VTTTQVKNWQPLTPADILTPAMPTDTSGILMRMLAFSEDARRQLQSSGEKQIIPRNVMTLLLRTMKLVDPGSLLHGQRIAAIASGIARLLGWDDEQRRQLEVSALLHDVGKLGVPEHILKKPGKLSSEEYDFVILHHHAGVCLLQALHTDPGVVTVLSKLYRDFDGRSRDVDSPENRDDLPLGSRILAVADAYDSLSTPKAYRRGMTHAESLNVLQEHAGSRYDGNVVRTLGRWYEAEGDSLFRFSDPLQPSEHKVEVPEQHRNEAVVLAQFINVLYQFQNLYDGYFLLDSNENYCVWSDGMAGLTGMPASSVVGRSWQPGDVLLVPITEIQPASVNRDETMVGQVFKNGRAQFGSRLCRMSESRHMKVDVYTMPILAPGGTVQGLVQLLRNKSGVRRQSREYVELKLAATRDPLTGVANRGQLETQLRHLLEDFHSQEGTRHLSCIFLDVDKFKRINDTYGHQVGDQVLVDLTRLLQNETYSAELIGRYGGEEFVIICPDTDLDSAVRRAERLRQAVMKSSIGGISTLNVTSSFGVATAHLGDTAQTMLERADNCLYRAKATGRNRTCWESELVEEPPAPAPDPELDKPTIVQSNGKLEFREKIEVSTSLELTAMKLQAFIREFKAEILGQDHGNMRVRLGTLGFTRRWGSTPERQPVEIGISFETTRAVSGLDGKPKTLRQISVIVHPHGKEPDGDLFIKRCVMLMRELRAYLLGS
jgi:diguanylate cyclase (GGDEF)-like protein